MDSVVTEQHWRAMGTSCHALVHAEPSGPDPRPIVVAIVADLEARWSRFIPTSELCRINDNAGRPTTVSEETVYAVHEALLARDRTGGRFDPTILPALCRAGYDRDYATVLARPIRDTAAVAVSSGAGAEVVVDVDAGTVLVERGAAIDLGGIGKGLAADIAATTVLGAPGVRGACVNLGGDLRGAGIAPSSAGWGVAIDDPLDPGATLATVAFASGAVATSSTQKRRWQADGRQVHHIIDPVTGLPSDDALWSVTVLADRSAVAEVLATAAIVAGPIGGAELLLASGAPALIVEEQRSRTLGSFEAYTR